MCIYAAKNVDINRCLVPTKGWENMINIMRALLERFGNFAKFKNQMSLSEADAEKLFHLRLILVSVQYDPGMTFAELCKDQQAHAHIYIQQKAAGSSSSSTRHV